VAGMSWARLGGTDLGRTSASAAIEGPSIGDVAVDLVDKRICVEVERQIRPLREAGLRLALRFRSAEGSLHHRVAL